MKNFSEWLGYGPAGTPGHALVTSVMNGVVPYLDYAVKEATRGKDDSTHLDGVPQDRKLLTHIAYHFPKEGNATFKHVAKVCLDQMDEIEVLKAEIAALKAKEGGE